MTKNVPETGATARQTEEELEAFRQQWRQEVSVRNTKPEVTSKSSVNEQRPPRRKELAASLPLAGPSTARPDYSEEVEPRAYHDLEDPEARLKLGEEGQNHDRDVRKEPSSALEHYERAVEKVRYLFEDLVIRNLCSLYQQRIGDARTTGRQLKALPHCI